MRTNAQRLILTASLLAGVALLSPALPGGGFALLQAGPAQAQSRTARAGDIAIEVGNTTYTINQIEASGTSLTDDELEALFDDESKATFAERMAKLNAAAISIPEILVELEIGGAKQALTYTNVKLVNVSKGVAAAISAAGGTVKVDAEKGDSLIVSLEGLEARNVDIGAILHAQFEARQQDGEPITPQYGSISFDRLALKDNKGVEFSVGKTTIKDLAGRALKTAFNTVNEKIAEMAADSSDPQKGQELAALYADLISSTAFSSMEMRDFAISVEKDANPGKMALARLALTNFGGGKLGEIAYEGFSLDTPEAKMKLASAAVRGLDFRPLIALAELFGANGQEAVEAGDPRDFIPTIDHVGLRGMEIDAAASDGQRGNAENGARNQFQLGALALDTANHIGGVPTTAALAIDHAVVDLSGLADDPEMKDFFALGYRNVDVSSKLDLGWSEASSELTVKNLSMNVVGMGALTMSATLGNISRDLFSSNQAVMAAAALGGLLTRAEVSIVNDGILEKALQSQAAKQGKTPQELRTILVAGAAVGIPAMLGDGPAARTIANAVAKFIAEPRTLKLQATSANGLGAGDIATFTTPADLLGKIDVKASVNE